MMRMKKSRFILAMIGMMLVTALLIGGAFFGVMEAKDVVLVSRSDYDKAEEMVKKYERKVENYYPATRPTFILGY